MRPVTITYLTHRILLGICISASVTVTNSEKKGKVGICKAQTPPNTDMVTDLPSLITDRVTDIPNGFMGFGWGSRNN